MRCLSPILSEDEFFDTLEDVDFRVKSAAATISRPLHSTTNAPASLVLHEKELGAVNNTSQQLGDVHSRLAYDQQNITTFFTTGDEHTREQRYDNTKLLDCPHHESQQRSTDQEELACKEDICRAEVTHAEDDTKSGAESRAHQQDLYGSECGAESTPIDNTTAIENRSAYTTPSRSQHRNANILATPQSAASSRQTYTPIAASPQIMSTSHGEDLFLEEADTQGSARLARLPGRLSRDKRQSVSQVETRAATSFEQRRPRTSGGLDDGRPVSRSGLRQQYAQPRARGMSDDTSSLVGTGLRSRLGSRYERQPLSPRSPNSNERSPESYVPLRSRFVAERPPLKLHDSHGSPAESIEHKQSIPDSGSADSQTAASTMWDDIDELKSRIKKLELASHADAIPQTERPRTATTAPTTIDSSPKREKKSDDASEDTQPTISAHAPASVHPLLHTALAKAKGLLSSALYRSLDATATDALQMVVMTGSSHNDTTMLDRQLKRKADSMCRNLTDLCLALCEGKHETSISPVSAQLSNASPTRYSRAPLPDSDPRPIGRPLSRLDARRSSILGNGSTYSPNSPRRDADELSEFETQSLYVPRRHLRSTSRVSIARASAFDDPGEDTIRATYSPSEFSFRSKPLPNARLFDAAPQRSFSLRDALNERRGSGIGLADHRDLSRVASMSSDAGRRWTRETTPPVLEEATTARHMLQPNVSGQRLGSFSSLRQSRVLAPMRSSSISSRRSQQVMME